MWKALLFLHDCKDFAPCKWFDSRYLPFLKPVVQLKTWCASEIGFFVHLRK
jgi:hypothetical protein